VTTSSSPATPSSTDPVTWADAERQAAFERWLAPLAATQGWLPPSLRVASADASMRRYLRIDGPGGRSAIVMDAPPALIDSRPFLAMAARITAAGLHAPQVLAADAEQGFVLLSDLGTRPYLDALREADSAEANRLMRDAIRALVHWQSSIDASALPPYDEAFLRRELAIFPEWCVQREFGIEWNEAQQARWRQVCDTLVASAS
jgi:N-acetylmuramate 1-kinase